MLPRSLWRGILILLLLLSVVPPVGAQEPEEDSVLQLMQRLPTRMKVGQLVLVSFPGTDLGDEAAIATLIEDYAVGGVLLRPENGNLGMAAEIAPEDVISMTNRLQRLSWYAARNPNALLPPDVLPFQVPYLPLFVAVEPDVGGLPVTKFISGTSALPSPLALGATWNRALAEATGQLVGRELAAVGVNFFLGPGLDVLDTPRPGDPADLGITTFGGNPYWVGELGQAYIRGLHQGSKGSLVVAPRHFPGLGSADRPFYEEVPTVQKSLAQLQRAELAPFYTVTDGYPGAESVADALLVTHSRYRGFQGNIRPSTRPISLDAQALAQALAGLSPWREAGGLLVADNLGLQSIRRFYDPSGTSLNARQVARDALLAGNDVLILDGFSASGTWEDHFANIRDTLDFMTQLYESAPTFQARVDEALYHVLSLKLRLNPRLSLSSVTRDPEQLVEALGQGEEVVTQVAASASTRLAPLSDDLLPAPPQEGERIVIFTQERWLQLAEDGPSLPTLSRDLLEQTLLRLYGSEGTGQVSRELVRQFTFQDLLGALDNPVPGEEESPNPAYQALGALQEAQWIIFATTGLDAQTPESFALKTFLEQQAPLLTGHIVVFSFGSPYELDSTEVSKLDLGYALYSPEEAFVQAGLRSLFQDLAVSGASPVSIPALNYDLAAQLQPAPQQTISLHIVNSEGQELTTEEQQDIRKDDVIYLRTSIISDNNGRPVPDETPAQFILSYPQEDRVVTVEATTRDGVALTSVVLDRVGLLDITVRSEPALPLFHLQLTLREGGQPVIIFSTTPTPVPDEPLPPTPSPDVEEARALPEPLRLPVPRRGYLLGWGLGGGLLAALLGFLWAQGHGWRFQEALRAGLWGAIGSLALYTLLMAGGRWIFPAGIYRLAGREFFLCGWALLGGGGALVIVQLTRRSGREDDGENE